MITKYIVFGDVHFESKDSKFLELILTAAESCSVDCILINGDLVNFGGVNRHGKIKPHRVDDFKNEIESVRDWLVKLRERFPSTEIVWNFGNHFQWADHYIAENAPIFLNLFSLTKFFQLDELKIKHNKYNKSVQFEDTNLWIRHSPHSYAVSGSMVGLNKCKDRSYIANCTHRTQSSHLGTANGNIMSYYFIGHVADVDTYQFDYTKDNHQAWTQSCAMVTIYDRKNFHVEQSLYRDNILMINGKIFTSE